ncbi:hypothetical protein [Enemella sp. A6]|uniref:hypothetical protein n=1 Tax=Enemella sp. A6 TaxID=3440152 RepID=UPI003EB8901E
MGDLSVHTQRLQKFGKEISDAADKFEAAGKDQWEDARLMGVSWPMLTLGLRVAYQDAHAQFGEVTKGAQSALDSLGQKITEVGNLYEQYERNA